MKHEAKFEGGGIVPEEIKKADMQQLATLRPLLC